MRVGELVRVVLIIIFIPLIFNVAMNVAFNLNNARSAEGEKVVLWEPGANGEQNIYEVERKDFRYDLFSLGNYVTYVLGDREYTVDRKYVVSYEAKPYPAFYSIIVCAITFSIILSILLPRSFWVRLFRLRFLLPARSANKKQAE
jgi:hypothetical protein